MKLSLLHEAGHWQVFQSYQGSLAPGTGTKVHTIFVDPKERRRSYIGKHARNVWGNSRDGRGTGDGRRRSG